MRYKMLGAINLQCKSRLVYSRFCRMKRVNGYLEEDPLVCPR